MKPIQIRTPLVLKRMWTIAARTASRGFPIDARKAVMQVPMLAPNTSAMPASRLRKPWLASTMITPVVAEELWMSAVKVALNRTARNGLLSSCIVSMKGG